jgi:SAM-dependent methyltransferase
VQFLVVILFGEAHISLAHRLVFRNQRLEAFRAHADEHFAAISEPVKALEEMHRVLRPLGKAVVMDLCEDISLNEIGAYVEKSGRNWFDAWITKWTFRHVVLKRAYTEDEFSRMAAQSHLGGCQISTGPIGFEARFTKPARPAVAVL